MNRFFSSFLVFIIMVLLTGCCCCRTCTEEIEERAIQKGKNSHIYEFIEYATNHQLVGKDVKFLKNLFGEQLKIFDSGKRANVLLSYKPLIYKGNQLPTSWIIEFELKNGYVTYYDITNASGK